MSQRAEDAAGVFLTGQHQFKHQDQNRNPHLSTRIRIKICSGGAAATPELMVTAENQAGITIQPTLTARTSSLLHVLIHPLSLQVDAASAGEKLSNLCGQTGDLQEM